MNLLQASPGSSLHLFFPTGCVLPSIPTQRKPTSGLACLHSRDQVRVPSSGQEEKWQPLAVSRGQSPEEVSTGHTKYPSYPFWLICSVFSRLLLPSLFQGEKSAVKWDGVKYPLAILSSSFLQPSHITPFPQALAM